ELRPGVAIHRTRPGRDAASAACLRSGRTGQSGEGFPHPESLPGVQSWIVPRRRVTPLLAEARRVRPGDAAELARALREADEASLAVVPTGAGTQQYVGNRPRRVDLVLETTSLSGIVEHTPADLTITVRAGTPFADLEAHLHASGQRLPLD